MDLQTLVSLLREKSGALWLWLIAINVIAFLVFGADKLLAKMKATNESVRRVPERTLFLLALLGGALGALLGMKVFRHKTLHTSFRVGIPLILLAWIAGLIYFASRAA